MNICCKSPPTWIIWSQVLNSNLNHICQILLWHHSEAAAQPLRHHCSSPGMHSCKTAARRYTEYTSDTYEMYRIYLWNTAHSRDAALRARSRDYPAHPSRRGNFPAPGLRQELGFPCFPLHIPQGSGIFRFTLTKLRKLQATPDLQILNLNRPLKSSWTQW